ncbi:hypothetical protein [Streptomyces cyaneofuscatus]|uniref:PE-PGRS family protein n=1 Tax=Streptomyces cyaneofuscatus TaxID=66883 RepID=A0ABZ1EYG9_9ACTN|nr:hypothetical protein [Streptomyces cyaneofuscatus]WSB09205.1 hypothetical protein OG849_19180 [Streptomyces cyaneofuscatus]WSD47259.1 hypothetical protein OG857_16220 [Streptomyces cyaneofuscatus]WTA90659.1 hypothetical protein OG323_17350 [Streptomyces cyaneofuscatus]
MHVHYSQIYVQSDPDGTTPGLGEAFAGQSGGLCGAAAPGALWLVTGLHTGSVGFTVEVDDEAPPLTPDWEDVVEVSFRPVSEDTSLVQWGGEAAWDLELPVTDYRVRYSARGMDKGRDLDTRTAKEPRADSYLLQFWPAPPRPDQVIRQTSRNAAYRHDYARGLPAPPTPGQRAEAERLARQAKEQDAEDRRRHYERWQWGGRLPNEALRGARASNVLGLLAFDSDLVHTLGASAPEVQHTVALRSARRACEAAGLTDLPWVADALSALDAGRPLPPPFDDPAGLWETLRSDPRVPDTSVLEAVPPERPPYQPPPPGPGDPYAIVETFPRTPRALHRISQPHFALPAVLAAAGPAPLIAALDAVSHALNTCGEHYPAFLDEIRSVCAAAVTEPSKWDRESRPTGRVPKEAPGPDEARPGSEG